MELLFSNTSATENLITLVLLSVICALPIVLFFKIWRACNDIHRIAEKLDSDE